MHSQGGVAMKLLSAVLMVGLGSIAAAPAPAAENNVLFVLDASGSMGGSVEGRPKLAVAREVLAGALAGLPPDFAVGLEAYGHRRGSDCADIEVLVPAGPGRGPAIESAMRALRPRGKTPITGALERAAEQARGLGGSTSVVLISDGRETCGGDPCGMVARLRAQGVSVTFHVVGFDVAEAERAQLRCIAEAGGGAYFGADGVGALSDALAAVSAKVVEEATTGGVRSAFDRDAAGWKVVGDARLDRGVDPSLDQGAIKAVDSATGGVWYWQAPASFLGDQRKAHGRELRFRLKSTPVTQPFQAPDVLLEGPAGVLVFDTPEDPGTEWTAYRVPLAAAAGWKRRESGQPASEADLREALGDLRNLLIRGRVPDRPRHRLAGRRGPRRGPRLRGGAALRPGGGPPGLARRVRVEPRAGAGCSAQPFQRVSRPLRRRGLHLPVVGLSTGAGAARPGSGNGRVVVASAPSAWPATLRGERPGGPTRPAASGMMWP